MSDKEIAEKIRKLKLRVSQIVGEVNELKKQLEQASISLPEFKQKKERLQDELRDILTKIAQYKEMAGISQVTKKESEIAGEAKDLMYYFPTDFEKNIYEAKVYLSITLDKHFIFTINFKDYPQRPIISVPDGVIEKFGTKEQFLQKIPSYINWNSNNPKHIYELVGEIEYTLINAYSASLETIEKESIAYIEETQNLIKKLIDQASTELQVKNIDAVIEIYKSIIDLAYGIKDFKIVSDYTFKLDQLLKIVRKNK
ncbi:MAG: hypothetical protein ACTSRP_23885 [Candidatus Helarchaeota archaeon]